jgi:hypothetical protein
MNIFEFIKLELNFVTEPHLFGQGKKINWIEFSKDNWKISHIFLKEPSYTSSKRVGGPCIALEILKGCI